MTSALVLWRSLVRHEVIRPRRDRIGSAIALGAAMLAAFVACSDAAERDTAPGTSPTGQLAPSEGAPDTSAEIPQRGASIDWEGGDVEQGSGLFATHCATCHGGDGRGDGPAAIALNPKPRDLTEGTFYIDANDDNETGEPIDLALVILRGPAAFGGSEAMQGWSETLSVDEVRHLVAFIESLSRRRE